MTEPAKTPVIRLVLEDPAGEAKELEEALRGRYLRGYRIVVGGAELSAGEQLALLILSHRGDGEGVAPSIATERARHPDARVVLLSERPRPESVTRRFDRHLIGRWDPPESRLYPILDDELAHWRASVDMPYARVRGVMTVRAVRVHIGESLHRAAEVIALSGVGDLMVIDDDNHFVGVLSVGDVLRAAMPDLDDVVAQGGTLDEAFRLFLRKGSELRHREIKPLVITSPLVVDPDDHVAKVAALMLEKNIHRLPVVKEGRLIGTVGRADICQAVVGTL
jgi:CBS domain-containing protein